MQSYSTTAGQLPLPNRLVALIDSGLWPLTKEEEMHQNIHSLVSSERIHLFAPEEDRIYFVRPPFHTIAELAISNAKFWSKWGALEEISPELSLDVGDFGLGSDSAIVLDYRQDRNNPSLIRLKWQKAQPNTWVRCAENFDQFADMLSLDHKQ